MPSRTWHDVVPSGANKKDQVPRLVDELFGDTGRRAAVGVAKTFGGRSLCGDPGGWQGRERKLCTVVDP